MAEMGKEQAIAIFQLAQEQHTEAEILSGLKAICGVMEQTPEMTAFLSSPGIPKQERLRVIDEAFSDAPEYAVSLLCLLCERGNAAMFPDCVREYEKLYAASRRRSFAVVKSAVELTDGEKEKLRQKLEKISGNTVEAEYHTDPSLLGGVLVEMDGTVFDGSLRHRLQNVKEVMDE